MKRIWTWIKNDCSWQKFHKSFIKFEENYFDLIFIIRQIRDMKRMTKEIMSHIAIIWKSDFRVFKTLNLHTLKSMKKWARVDYTMIKILQLFKKIVIYRLHHAKREIFEKNLSTATNWTRVTDEFCIQESISKDVLKALNLKDEKSFLSKEKEQSTFAHINLENLSKIIQDLIKTLMNETQQLLLTLKSTSTKCVKESRQNENQLDLNDQTQSDLNRQTQSDFNRQTQSDLNRRFYLSDSVWSQRSDSARSQRLDSFQSQWWDSVRSQRSDSVRSQSSDSVRSRSSDSVRS
jgi:hypothetical protein